MSEPERDLIRDLLGLINLGVFPGQGAERNALVTRANDALGETVGVVKRVG